jgi:alginate O-acetyltransferase complex protein AlgJ
MAAGAWQIFAASTDARGLEFPRTWTDFREGRSTGALEKQLDQKLPARPALITTANSVRYLLTGSGGEQVRVGKDGWLFLVEELRFDPNGHAHLAARALLLGAAARALDRQGVKLVVALVPDKARVHAGKLASGHYPDYNSARYSNSLSAFQSQGVTVVDLLKPLAQAAASQEVYYRTDTHWNQNGAQVAATAIASAVEPLHLELEGTSFTSTPSGAQTERPGDLIRLMGLDGAPRALAPRADLEAPITTRQASADAPSGLFGDSSVPVVLTGTSYSLRANFAGFLQQALAAKVLNAAKDGGGFLLATTQYLKDDAFRSAKPKLLLWELPERFLYSPLVEEPQWLKNVGLDP